MTFLVERLAELRRHVDHLCQLVIDIAGELSARGGYRFEDYTTAVRNLGRMDGFSRELVEELSRLPGLRNILIHDYVGLDYDLVVGALDRLEPIEEFIDVVGRRVQPGTL